MEKTKKGRPRIEINQQTFEGLCSIQCTQEEIASVLRCSPDTVERWCKRTYNLNFAEVYKKFSADGKKSLRRAMFEMAMTKPNMAIWLSKQYLGMRDNPVEVTHTVSPIDELTVQMFELQKKQREDEEDEAGDIE